MTDLAEHGPAVADPLGDPDRIRAARRLLDHLPPAASLDRLGRLAARAAGVPLAVMSLVTEEQTVVGGYGLPVGVPGWSGAPAGTLSTRVVREGGTLALESTVAAGQEGPVAFLGTPLVDSGGRLVGVLAVATRGPHAWREVDVEVVEQLAASVVAELELAATNAELARSLTRLDVALEAGDVGAWEIDLLAGTVIMDERSQVLLGLPGSPVRERATVLDAVHPDDRPGVQAALRSAVESGGAYRTEVRSVLPDGSVRWIASRGRVLLDPAGRPRRVVGTVQDVTDLRRGAAERLAALQRAAAIGGVAGSLASVVTVADLSDVALAGAHVLGADSGALSVFEPDGRLRMHLSRQLHDWVVDRGVDLPSDGVVLELDDRMPAQFTARTGEPVLLGDPATAVAHFPALDPVLEMTGVQAIAALPLRVEGRLTGSFSLTWPHPREFPEGDVDLLQALAAQLAGAFSRLQADAAREEAVADMARAAERLELLAEAGRVLSGTLDIAEQIGQLASLVVPVLGDWCWVVVTDDSGRLHDLASAHRDPERAADLERYVRSMVTVMTESAGARVVTRTGKPLVLRTITREDVVRALPDRATREVFEGLGPAAATVVPLVARGQVLGALGLFLGPDRAPHSREEQETAAEIGRRAGLALYHARLFDQQRQLAEALQRSMLTAPPEPDHCQIEVRYVPAASGAEIGGDWYDAFLQDDGATVLAIGDVVGHDNRAAASMGQLRGLLRGIAYSSGGSPAEVLTGLDRAMAGLALPAMATALVARLERGDDDLPAGRAWLRWSSAGHPPLVRLARDGTPELVDGAPVSLLLGVDGGTARTDTVTELAVGDTVLLYTDGLIERRDRDLDAGTTELLRVLAEVAGAPLDQLCDRVLERMFLPDAEDDVALLAVRLHDPSRPRPPEAGPQRVPPTITPAPSVTPMG